MRIRLDSLGCRLNIGEMDALARRFSASGHRVVGAGERADLAIFNTCAVTHVASRKSRKTVRQLRRTLPDAAIVVTGCYAELEPEAVRELGVDAVIGNADKDRLPEILTERGLLTRGEPLPEVDADHLGALPGTRTRAFLKVQDGCDNRCTFCIVTVARGEGRSRPLPQILDEVRGLTALGYQEVVLTGVHLGSYGHDAGDSHGLERLSAAILGETDIPRVRLSSLEPWDLRPEFFDLWADPRLQPHLHLPLQSGCDATLRRMSRRTSQTEFTALLDAARGAIPGLAVSTDVIVGFPGECDAEFEDSLAFVEALDFARLHVFRYSAREGTAAAMLPGQVSESAIQERSARMHELNAGCEESFRRRQLGARVDVLWETSEPRGDLTRWSGLTGNYVRVVTDTPPGVDLANRVEPTLLVELVPGGMLGVCDASAPLPDALLPTAAAMA